jgi:hypothetical protein
MADGGYTALEYLVLIWDVACADKALGLSVVCSAVGVVSEETGVAFPESYMHTEVLIVFEVPEVGASLTV